MKIKFPFQTFSCDRVLLQVFVMYHSTKTWQQAESILDNGFYLSNHKNTMLGRGIYVSSTIQKTYGYGDITFKLLVYPGRICTITHQGHPRQKSWQSSFGSAWTPPNTYGMVKYQVSINTVHKFLYNIEFMKYFRKIAYKVTIKYESWEYVEGSTCFHGMYKKRPSK